MTGEVNRSDRLSALHLLGSLEHPLEQCMKWKLAIGSICLVAGLLCWDAAWYLVWGTAYLRPPGIGITQQVQWLSTIGGLLIFAASLPFGAVAGDWFWEKVRSWRQGQQNSPFS